MKKFFVIFSVVFMVMLFGCEQVSGGSSVSDDGLIAQGAEGGFSWQVKRNVTVESGITNDGIAYQIREDATGKTITFGVVKMTSGNNVSYRCAIIATKKDSPLCK